MSPAGVNVHGLEFYRVTKSFGAVEALRGVSFEVSEGESHALVGENGAGKSTLLKILGGVQTPDRGDIRWKGDRLAFGSPRDALTHGIGIVHQEMLAFPTLSVSANIFAGRELTTRWGRLREAEMRERTAAILARLRAPIAADAEVGHLSAAHRQLVQIARALAFDCRVLVLDEPTTALTAAETEHLFEVLAELRARGVTILYVSHRLPEVFRLCDRITVLRDGACVGTFRREETTPGDIVRAMVGRDLPPRRSTEAVAAGPPLFAVKALARRPHVTDVSLHVGRGEIVALFGLVGSGRSELVETLFGLVRPDRGTILLDGRPVHFRSPRDAARAGLAFVPEERQRQGLFFTLVLLHNLVMPSSLVRRAMLVGRRERRLGEQLVHQWRIRAAGIDALPDTLSGGNQQKVVLARWLALRPRVLLLDEPTKGVDVGAKYEIHEFIRAEAARGAGCLVVSSDLPEVLAIAHRIVVMREGRIQGELAAAEATEEAVMRLATAQAETSPPCGPTDAPDPRGGRA